MGMIAHDRVADIVKMRDLRVIEDDDVLRFAGIAQNAVFTDDDVFPDKGAMSDLGVRSDDGRSD